MANPSAAAMIALNVAAQEASALGHIYIDTDHILLGLLKIEDVLMLNKNDLAGISETDWDKACSEISDFSARLKKGGMECKKIRRQFRGILVYENLHEKGAFSGHRTPKGRETFEMAERLCHQTASTQIELPHLFFAALNQWSTGMERLFSRLYLDKDNILKSGFAELHTDAGGAQPDGGEKREKPAKGSKTPYLDKYGKDLTKLAREGKLEPTIGRHAEMKKMAQILVQKKKNNPILVGDAGVGKTCIVEGLAQSIVQPGAPEPIQNLRIVELSMGTLVAGTKYRGDFEERLDMLLKEAAADPNTVLFFDEVHLMVGAGAAGEGGMDAANILKPALARGEMKCIGATTTAEYRKYIEKDPALERRFQMVWVDEPTPEDAVLILQGIKPRYEEYYKIQIPDEAIRSAVSLSVRYLTDFRLPDKAIDLIDQACSAKMLITISGEGSKGMEEKRELSANDIASVVSVRCRIPVDQLTSEETERLMNMEDFLRQRVRGQDQAITILAETIRKAKAGLKDPGKPIGVFLFLGSTGIGKTELAKALAEFLFHDENKMVSIDMSEYQEKHSVAKLLGAPPGYVGFDEEGILSHKIRTNPYSVVVFDEIEKAHPDVFDLFLQIFDEGRLTDSHGRRINFSESVIILTSNLGAANRVKPKRPIGFDLADKSEGKAEDGGQEAKEDRTQYEQSILSAVNSSLRPEILNRIDKKIFFYPLNREAIYSIIQKIQSGINKRLAPQRIQITLTDRACDFLMQKGYSAEYGAREMQRAFETHITEPLSKKILAGEVRPGDRVTIDHQEELSSMTLSRGNETVGSC